VPQFLLRNFSRRFGKRDPKKKLYPDTKVVNVLGLGDADPTLTVQRVDRTFGQYDMYSDSTALTQEQKRCVETGLSKLENQASEVIKKLLPACDGEDLITLTHDEVFTLKKFIFIMKYRSTLFYKRYNHQSCEEYNESDEAEMMAYMQTRGFTRPIDVWHDNILNILNTKAQNEDQYVSELSQSMYPSDAVWVEKDMTTKYPVLCVPLHKDEEFVLSEHSFCLYEGPSDRDGAWTDFHVFCIIAPRLAIILRLYLLPERLEDSDDELSSRKKQVLERALSAHHFPDEATSLFRDLPVYKPRSGYQKNKYGSLVQSPSTQRSKGIANSLGFPVARIDSNDLQTINALAFNEAYDLSKIAFATESALKRALEFFLRMPSTGVYSMKNYSSEMDPRVLHLKRLEKASELLGPKVEGVYKLRTSEIVSEEEFIKRFGQESSRNEPRSEPYQSYTAPMNEVLEVERNSRSTASTTPTKSSSKDSRDDPTILEQIMARISQLETTPPKEQPEPVKVLKGANFFLWGYENDDTESGAVRAAMQPSTEIDRFFESVDKNRSK
jgi:hypothetical protein